MKPPSKTPDQLAALAKARKKRGSAAPRMAPEGWRSVQHLMTDTREYCARKCVPGHHSELRSLANYLGVNESSVRRWLSGEKTPMQKNIDSIAQWRRNRAAGL